MFVSAKYRWTLDELNEVWQSWGQFYQQCLKDWQQKQEQPTQSEESQELSDSRKRNSFPSSPEVGTKKAKYNEEDYEETKEGKEEEQEREQQKKKRKTEELQEKPTAQKEVEKEEGEIDVMNLVVADSDSPDLAKNNTSPTEVFHFIVESTTKSINRMIKRKKRKELTLKCQHNQKKQMLTPVRTKQNLPLKKTFFFLILTQRSKSNKRTKRML
jgi:hypothetical protein